MALLPRHKARRLFDPDRPVYARRELTIGDRTFQPGDVVPLAELDVAVSTAQMWYRVRFIGHDAPVMPEAPEEGKKVEEAPVVEEPKMLAEEPAPEPTPATKEPAKKQRR